MPRQIIDTESSRPAYVRRNILIAVLVVIIVAAVAFFAYRAFAVHHVAAAGGAFAALAGALPGTLPATLKPAKRTRPKEKQCCVA